MSYSSRKQTLFAALAAFLIPVAVWAASEFSSSAEHVTKKSPEHVLEVLTGYGKTCDKGCKYYGPDLVEFIALPQKKTATSWYTWSHVSTTMKTVKFFSFVQLAKKDDGSFVMTTRQLEDKDKAVIDELSKASKKEHSPAFDSGTTKFTVTKLADGQTKVIQAMTMSASGMLAMFGGKIRDGMKNGAAVTFQNIEK
jgi:hypothetical protein